MVTKSIVILANSVKNQRRCVAGKEVIKTADKKWKLTDNWIRPVTEHPPSHGAIPDGQCIDPRTRRMFRPMDIVEIELDTHVPEQGQPENWTFNETKPWAKLGRFKSSVATRLLDTPTDVWLDPNASKISLVSEAYAVAGHVDSSLLLIQPEKFRLHLSNEYNPFENRYQRKMKASFRYKGTSYSGLGVTDTTFTAAYAGNYPNQGDPSNIIKLPNGDSYSLCISLAPPFAKNNNTQSKLLAAVISQS